MADAITAYEPGAPDPPPEPTFADAVARWLHHLEFVKGIKPSTLVTPSMASPGRPSRLSDEW